MTKRTHAPRRRTQHVGVLSDGVWTAHDRRVDGATVPRPLTSTDQNAATNGWQVFSRPDRSEPGAAGRPRMVTHGRRRSYQQGCRCVDCTAANSAYYHARRQKENSHE